MRLFCWDRKKALAGAALGALCFACCLLTCAGERAMLAAGAILSLGFVALGPVRLGARAAAHPALLHLIYSLLALLGICVAAQTALRLNFLYCLSRIPLNMACAALLALLLFAATLRPRLSLALASLPLMLLTIVDSFVLAFRGFEVDITDLASARTALGVIGNYRLRVDPALFLGLALWALILFSGLCLPALRIRRRRAARAGALALALCLLAVDYRACSALPVEAFTHDGSRNSGLFANFAARSLLLMHPDVPEGYSPEAVAALEANYADSAATPAEGAPTVIVILNESFVDLSVLGSEPDTAQDALPFFHSLRENAIRGRALSPTYAGGTSYAEYAVLSGNMLERNSIGKNVYPLCIKRPSSSMLATLRRLGYTCASTHPYSPSSWSRSTAFPMLGFDEMEFLDGYPQRDIVRKYVSDREVYAQVIDRCDRAAAADEKLFLFGITMQNHGGYNYSGDGYTPRAALEGNPGTHPDAEQYLGLLRESDAALEELIAHFRDSDRRVAILFFGDHFPGLDEAFWEELHGGPLASLDEQELTYTVPFFVWTNYDIEERDVGLTSLNYLSGYLLEAAGLELPAYNRFLRDMEQVIPALNPLGYYSAARGRFLPFDEAEGEEAKWLNDYDMLQYNSLFDAAHRSERFFPLPEVASAE